MKVSLSPVPSSDQAMITDKEHVSLLVRLGKVSHDVGHLYHSEKTHDIPALCADIIRAVQLCTGLLQTPIDINKDILLASFLKSSLPVLVEVFMRKKTLR